MNKKPLVSAGEGSPGVLLSLTAGLLIISFGVVTYAWLIMANLFYFAPMAEFLLTLLVIFGLLVILGAYFTWLKYPTIGGRLTLLSTISSTLLFLILHGGYGLKYVPPSFLPRFLIGFYIVPSTLGIVGGAIGLDRGKK